jgi:SAM-dependent methyltransferase
VLLHGIYRLPFEDSQFETVFCSHTLEHVEDPGGLFAELCRVDRSVTAVVPPLWDLSAALNVFEHSGHAVAALD